MIRFSRLSVLFLLACLLPPAAGAAAPAFPGAEGFGAQVTGGRGGAVIEVTNLNDSGPGSLRAAITASETRTIVFRVSGTIYLETDLVIRNGNLTIAGQTAPGDGITVARRALVVDKANNVIIRFIRVRLGDLYPRDKGLATFESDAFECRYSTNIIIDHCSFSWSIDETASAYNNKNFTMQWCIVSESLYDSFHSKGKHGYAGIWGGRNASFHHNLLAHHTSRNPRFQGARYADYAEWGDGEVDHRHNVIYNWASNSAYGGEPNPNLFRPKYNLVGNVYKAGPATPAARADRICEPYPDPISGQVSTFHVAGNYVFNNLATSRDNWRGMDNIPAVQKQQYRFDEPFPMPAVEAYPALEAYEQVLAHAGASFPRRDSVDERLVGEVRAGTAAFGNNGIIDSQDQVGGYPVLQTLPAPADGDRDGMPDDWELARNLNPADPADRNGDLDGDGYTNLEEYLNGLVEDHFTYTQPLSYAAWSGMAFWDPLLPAGRDEDADGDTMSNFNEFAYRRDPTAADAVQVPQLHEAWSFAFIHRRGTTLHYAIQASADLAEWTTAWSTGDSLDTPRIIDSAWGYHADALTWDAAPEPGQSALYWRIRVTDQSVFQ